MSYLNPQIFELLPKFLAPGKTFELIRSVLNLDAEQRES